MAGDDAIEWEKNEGDPLTDAERDALAAKAIKAALESEHGIGLVMTGDSAAIAIDDGEGVVEVLDCVIRREAEVEVQVQAKRRGRAS